MASDTYIEARTQRITAALSFVIGVVGLFVGCGIGSASLFNLLPLAQRNDLLLISLLGVMLGVGAIVMGVVGIIDRTVRLAVNSEGIHDSRTGRFVRWEDYRSCSLHIFTLNGAPIEQTLQMIVRVDGQNLEVKFDLKDLDISAETIAQTIHDLGLEALAAQPPTSDVKRDEVMDAVRRALDDGHPLSTAAAQLLRFGFDTETAARMAEEAAGGDIARCDRCGLRYRGTVNACKQCRGSLIYSDPFQFGTGY